MNSLVILNYLSLQGVQKKTWSCVWVDSQLDTQRRMGDLLYIKSRPVCSPKLSLLSKDNEHAEQIKLTDGGLYIRQCRFLCGAPQNTHYSTLRALQCSSALPSWYVRFTSMQLDFWHFVHTAYSIDSMCCRFEVIPELGHTLVLTIF